MPTQPLSHIEDSHKLVADAKLMLFELTPSLGTGVIRFTSDSDLTWKGNTYTGVPLALSGEKQTSDSGLTLPTLTIGDENVDISQFKPLIFTGALDNATIVKYTVLGANYLANLDIKETQVYRVKRVTGYTRTQLALQLATLSDSLGFSLPYRTFTTPDFPTVNMGQ